MSIRLKSEELNAERTMYATERQYNDLPTCENKTRLANARNRYQRAMRAYDQRVRKPQ